MPHHLLFLIVPFGTEDPEQYVDDVLDKYLDKKKDVADMRSFLDARESSLERLKAIIDSGDPKYEHAALDKEHQALMDTTYEQYVCEAESGYSPDGKYISADVGGVFATYLLTHEGRGVTYARLCDIDFDGMNKEYRREGSDYYDMAVGHAKKDCMNEYEKHMWLHGHGIGDDESKEEFLDRCFHHLPWPMCIIDEKGDWNCMWESYPDFHLLNEPAALEEISKWDRGFYDRFLRSLDPDTLMVVVDVRR